MSGNKRYFLDTNALVALGCGEDSLRSLELRALSRIRFSAVPAR